jgi:hypothetical protein
MNKYKFEKVQNIHINNKGDFNNCSRIHWLGEFCSSCSSNNLLDLLYEKLGISSLDNFEEVSLHA